MTTDDTISAVARHLAQARRILFITGAGISADSGLPTYRGVGGLYDSDLTAEGCASRRCCPARYSRCARI
jgi:NAD-dependent deacetylase